MVQWWERLVVVESGSGTAVGRIVVVGSGTKEGRIVVVGSGSGTKEGKVEV